jgi:hypothetical protein
MTHAECNGVTSDCSLHQRISNSRYFRLLRTNEKKSQAHLGLTTNNGLLGNESSGKTKKETEEETVSIYTLLFASHDGVSLESRLSDLSLHEDRARNNESLLLS